MEEQIKMGRMRRGWEIVKSSWRVLKLEPGLITVEVISFMVSLVAFVAFVVTGLWLGEFTVTPQGEEFVLEGWQSISLFASFVIVTTVIYSLMMGWFSHMVVERLKGNDPTVGGSFSAMMSKFWPLAAFGILSGTVGTILQILQERLPFLGKIFAFLAEVAWSVATIFSIPVIVNSEQKVGPLDAVKLSAKLIRKTWGEGVVSQFGIGAVGVLAVLGYVVVTTIAGVALATVSTGAAIGVVIVGILGFIALLVLLSLLGSIAQSVLYYYAMTGKEPAGFNKQLLRDAMTPKKARKIFG